MSVDFWAHPSRPRASSDCVDWPAESITGVGSFDCSALNTSRATRSDPPPGRAGTIHQEHLGGRTGTEQGWLLGTGQLFELLRAASQLGARPCPTLQRAGARAGVSAREAGFVLSCRCEVAGNPSGCDEFGGADSGGGSPEGWVVAGESVSRSDGGEFLFSAFGVGGFSRTVVRCGCFGAWRPVEDRRGVRPRWRAGFPGVCFDVPHHRQLQRVPRVWHVSQRRTRLSMFVSPLAGACQGITWWATQSSRACRIVGIRVACDQGVPLGLRGAVAAAFPEDPADVVEDVPDQFAVATQHLHDVAGQRLTVAGPDDRSVPLGVRESRSHEGPQPGRACARTFLPSSSAVRASVRVRS